MSIDVSSLQAGDYVTAEIKKRERVVNKKNDWDVNYVETGETYTWSGVLDCYDGKILDTAEGTCIRDSDGNPGLWLVSIKRG